MPLQCILMRPLLFELLFFSVEDVNCTHHQAKTVAPIMFPSTLEQDINLQLYT
jgi:hypothetical protein